MPSIFQPISSQQLKVVWMYLIVHVSMLLLREGAHLLILMKGSTPHIQRKMMKAGITMQLVIVIKSPYHLK